MKKSLFLAFVTLALIASPVYANCGACGMTGKKEMKGKTCGKAVDAKLKKMTKTLSLTEEQTAKVQGLMEAKMEKKRALHEETEAKMETIHEEFKTDLKGVLTPEQMEKFEMKHMKGKKESCHSGCCGHGHKNK